MAKTLDDLLQPGERVLWRDPEPRLRDAWPRVLGTVIGITGLMVSMMGRGGLEAWAMFFGITFTVLMAGELISCCVIPWLSGRVETVLTAGRLLHGDARPGGRLVENPLVEMTKVAVDQVTLLNLKMRDGETTVLTRISQTQALAKTLAETAGLPPPRDTGRLAGLWWNGHWLGSGACIVLVVACQPEWIPSILDELQTRDFFVSMGWLLSLVITSSLIGRHLGAVLGLVALRRKVSAAEAWAWIDLAKQSEERERAWKRWCAHLMEWRSPFYTWLVRLLWGEPMNGPNAEAAGHG